jgi:hypothetical protein
MSGLTKQKSIYIAAFQKKEKTISWDASAAVLKNQKPTQSRTTNDLTAFDLHSIYCHTVSHIIRHC